MAKRAMKRLNGEDVFGNKIVVSEKREIRKTGAKRPSRSITRTISRESNESRIQYLLLICYDVIVGTQIKNLDS